MDDYFAEDNTLEFWDISIDRNRYPAARGVMYGKPTPSTVQARITFPRDEPTPYLRLHQRTRLTAYCANRQWMRNIAAEVKDIIDNRDRSQTVELLLYRKGTEPWEDLYTKYGVEW